jgi:hypothetical protein
LQKEAQENLCRLRALQLRLALMTFQKDRGRPAQSLDELVPAILPVLPPDPYTGERFGYRLSRGERLPWKAGPGRPLLAAADQGVLWSTGPDRVNDGGTIQARDPSPGGDWIFLVPR